LRADGQSGLRVGRISPGGHFLNVFQAILIGIILLAAGIGTAAANFFSPGACCREGSSIQKVLPIPNSQNTPALPPIF